MKLPSDEPKRIPFAGLKHVLRGVSVSYPDCARTLVAMGQDWVEGPEGVEVYGAVYFDEEGVLEAMKHPIDYPDCVERIEHEVFFPPDECEVGDYAIRFVFPFNMPPPTAKAARTSPDWFGYGHPLFGEDGSVNYEHIETARQMLAELERADVAAHYLACESAFQLADMGTATPVQITSEGVFSPFLISFTRLVTALSQRRTISVKKTHVERALQRAVIYGHANLTDPPREGDRERAGSIWYRVPYFIGEGGTEADTDAESDEAVSLSIPEYRVEAVMRYCLEREVSTMGKHNAPLYRAVDELHGWRLADPSDSLRKDARVYFGKVGGPCPDSPAAWRKYAEDRARQEDRKEAEIRLLPEAERKAA